MNSIKNNSLNNQHWEIDHHLQLLEETKKSYNQNLLQQEPLKSLIEDEDITEILVNSYKDVFYEKKGCLIKATTHFESESIYNQTLEEICSLANTYFNKEKPFVETHINNKRFTLIYSDLSKGSHLLSIRKHLKNHITLKDLHLSNWCNNKQYDLLCSILNHKNNFLIVGGTSSGKTTVLQALINSTNSFERSVLIEDTQELNPSNHLSISLVTPDQVNIIDTIDLSYLLKRALRLRPDRIIVGEVRGPEAKDLLMSMSTGHAGCMGTLHAKNEHEALLRLEMLVQMGAPQWSVESIRKLIAMAIEYVIVVHKIDGERKLEGIYKVQSLENTGFVFYKMDEG